MTSPRLLVSTLVITVLRQSCVVSAGRSAPQDTPHNSSAELALLHPLTDKQMGLREATLIPLWQCGNCMSQLSTGMSSFLRRLLWGLRKLCCQSQGLPGNRGGHGAHRSWETLSPGPEAPSGPYWRDYSRVGQAIKTVETGNGQGSPTVSPMGRDLCSRGPVGWAC